MPIAKIDSESPQDASSTLTAKEIAEDLRICIESARRLCRRGLLKRILGLREIRVTPEAYNDFKYNRFDADYVRLQKARAKKPTPPTSGGTGKANASSSPTTTKSHSRGDAEAVNGSQPL